MQQAHLTQVETRGEASWSWWWAFGLSVALLKEGGTAPQASIMMCVLVREELAFRETQVPPSGWSVSFKPGTRKEEWIRTHSRIVCPSAWRMVGVKQITGWLIARMMTCSFVEPSSFA